MERARQSYEGSDAYNTGYEIGYKDGVHKWQDCVESWLTEANNLASSQDELYNFLKDTFNLLSAEVER